VTAASNKITSKITEIIGGLEQLPGLVDEYYEALVRRDLYRQLMPIRAKVDRKDKHDKNVKKKKKRDDEENARLNTKDEIRKERALRSQNRRKEISAEIQEVIRSQALTPPETIPMILD